MTEINYGLTLKWKVVTPVSNAIVDMRYQLTEGVSGAGYGGKNLAEAADGFLRTIASHELSEGP